MPDLDATLPNASLPPAGAPAAPPARVAASGPAWKVRHTLATLGLIALIGLAALALAWQAKERVRALEQELVRRQQEVQTQSAEARALSKQAEESARETAAKMALLEARVAEVAVQRGQIEELIQSLSRSRDENLLVDIDAAVRMAQQQSVLTGSVEPLVITLKQADERLARHNQPRLEGVRRAVARDLDRVKAVGVADTAGLGIKLDEAVRLIDELPLASQPASRADAERAAPAAGAPAPVRAPSDAHSDGDASALPGWLRPWADGAAALGQRVWAEARSLVRITRIDHPEAMLLAPEQAFFLRENLKLRLLNARLALLARQFDTAQADLQAVQRALDRYFDRGARRTVLAADLLRQVAEQARQTSVPRPDDTLAAVSAAAAGR